MRIAVDVMGTDNRPIPDIAGALEVARETGDIMVLIGNEQLIREHLNRQNTVGLKIEVINATDEIAMDDKPGAVVKGKPNSSMHIGMRLVKDGQADAFVTMGNTGAALAIATVSVLRRIPGIKRPALTVVFPLNQRLKVLLDLGANADSKPEWLQQFAIMGSIYAEKVLEIANPRVGLISNGEEDTKGNTLIQEAQKLIAQSKLNFVGYIEPADITHDNVDVAIMDGFVGNIFLKTFEASIRYMTKLIRNELMSGMVTQVGALLTRPAFQRVRDNLNLEAYSGALLLGVEGVVVIGHGGADPAAVQGAIHQARQAVQHNIVESIKAHVQEISLGE